MTEDEDRREEGGETACVWAKFVGGNVTIICSVLVHKTIMWCVVHWRGSSRQCTRSKCVVLQLVMMWQLCWSSSCGGEDHQCAAVVQYCDEAAV